MPDVCWNCGEEIEFRWVDGSVRPNHESGFCPATDSGHSSYRVNRHLGQVRRAPREPASARWGVGHARCDLGVPLTHPTQCPVCGEIFFFHTNGNGDCVFFDSLGKPWPKHGSLSTDDDIRSASRNGNLMRIVDLVAPPTHIPSPSGVVIKEFDDSRVEQIVVGVVLSLKEKTVWRSQTGSAVRVRTQMLSIIMQVGPEDAIRVFAPLGLHAVAGDLIRMAIHEERIDGRRVMYSDAGGRVSPEDDGPISWLK